LPSDRGRDLDSGCVYGRWGGGRFAAARGVGKVEIGGVLAEGEGISPAPFFCYNGKAPACVIVARACEGSVEFSITLAQDEGCSLEKVKSVIVSGSGCGLH
jgi:hypothetical protein